MQHSPSVASVSQPGRVRAFLMRDVMTSRSIRWRVIVLQVAAILVLAFGSFGAFYAHGFIDDQIHQELAPQQIFFPASAATGLPSDLSAYAGQQVLTGDQAQAYADKFIALHLQEIGQRHPYSYWSALAQKGDGSYGEGAGARDRGHALQGRDATLDPESGLDLLGHRAAGALRGHRPAPRDHRRLGGAGLRGHRGPPGQGA